MLGLKLKGKSNRRIPVPNHDIDKSLISKRKLRYPYILTLLLILEIEQGRRPWTWASDSKLPEQQLSQSMPHSFRGKIPKEAAADSRPDRGTGSRLFEINMWTWSYVRTLPCKRSMELAVELRKKRVQDSAGIQGTWRWDSSTLPVNSIMVYSCHGILVCKYIEVHTTWMFEQLLQVCQYTTTCIYYQYCQYIRIYHNSQV